MSEDRLILAIGRLERALTRIERAAVTWHVSEPRADREVADETLKALTVRHARLKHEVEGAVAALDGLIAKG